MSNALRRLVRFTSFVSKPAFHKTKKRCLCPHFATYEPGRKIPSPWPAKIFMVTRHSQNRHVIYFGTLSMSHVTFKPCLSLRITSVYAPNVKCKWFFTLAIDGKWGAVSGGESTRLLLAAGTHRKSPTPWRHRGCDWWRHSIFFNPLHHPPSTIRRKLSSTSNLTPRNKPISCFPTQFTCLLQRNHPPSLTHTFVIYPRIHTARHRLALGQSEAWTPTRSLSNVADPTWFSFVCSGECQDKTTSSSVLPLIIIRQRHKTCADEITLLK